MNAVCRNNRAGVTKMEDRVQAETAKSSRAARKGFTIIELMIVVSVIGILSSIAAISLSKSVKNAKNAQLKTMVKNVISDVHTYIGDYDTYHRVGKNYDKDYLNGKLETLWENKPYGNVFGHRNPYSQSEVILNWRSVPASLRSPAVFMTSNKRYHYDAIAPETAMKELQGSVVVWMANKVSEIHAYYIDIDGRKSYLRLFAE